MTEHPVDVRNVTLEYRLDRHNVGTYKEALVRFLTRDTSYESIQALDDVSFTVARGEIHGVDAAGHARLPAAEGRTC